MRRPTRKQILPAMLAAVLAAGFAVPTQAAEAPQPPSQELKKQYQNHKRLADYFVQAGQYEAAILEANRGLAMNPDSAFLYNVRGRALYMIGQYEEALKNYQKVLTYHKSAIIVTNIGMAYNALNQDEKALESYQEALQLDPRHAAGWYQLGMFQKKKGNLEDAEKNFRKAVQLKPSHAYSHYELARILEKKGDASSLKESQFCYQQAKTFGYPFDPVELKKLQSGQKLYS